MDDGFEDVVRPDARGPGVAERFPQEQKAADSMSN